MLIVAVNSFYDKNHNWQKTTYVYLFPISVDNNADMQKYIDGLSDKGFAEINDYMSERAKKYNQKVSMYYRFGGQVKEIPPVVPRKGSIIDAIIWSLKFRYYNFKNRPAVSLYSKRHKSFLGLCFFIV